MILKDNQLRQFKISEKVTLAQLASAGCEIHLSNTDKLPKGMLKLSDDPGESEYWNRPHYLKALRESENLKLPAPRLQLTWIAESEDWYSKTCLYTLVIPIGNDIRGNGDDGKTEVYHEWHAMISTTSVTGGLAPIRGGEIDTPFRDHVHAQWDSKALGGFPIFVVCGKDYKKLEPQKE